MRIKKIMIITFLLFFVLTVAAVSAADDVASNNLNATDSDIVNYDADDYDLSVNFDENICIDESDNEYDEDAEIATITPPNTNVKGSFQIKKENGDVVVSMDFKKKANWKYDDDLDEYYGSICLKDLNLTKISNGDVLYFKFLEGSDGNYNEVKDLTEKYKVNLTSSVLKLSEMDDETEFEGYIHQVNNTNLNSPDVNFIQVIVSKKDGTFTISLDGEYQIFEEDLNTTQRKYTKFIDENDDEYLSFLFSLTDLNNFIANSPQLNATSFKNLVDKKNLSSGSYMEFEVGSDEFEEMIFTITPDNELLFYESDDYDVEAINLKTEMYGEFQKVAVINYAVKKGINGRVIVYLNDDTLPAFNKTLSEMSHVVDKNNDEFYIYAITIEDLNITKEGSYVLKYNLYDDNKNAIILQYDSNDIDTLELYKTHTVTVDNVSVKIIAKSTPFWANNTAVIKIIDPSAAQSDQVFIYVNENKIPIIINITECEKSTDGNYSISHKQLGLGVGKYNLNVTYKKVNLNYDINLISGMSIVIMNDETVYTTFNDVFAYIGLADFENDDISKYYDVGQLNVTLCDKDRNVVGTFQTDIDDLAVNYDPDMGVYFIKTNDINNLVGNYTVFVTYMDGHGYNFTEKGTILFKSFEASDYGASVKEIVKSKNDAAIIFADIPLEFDIYVEVDGNKTRFDEEDISTKIKVAELGNLKDGIHSVVAYIIDNRNTRYNLTSGNLIVDFEENADIQLAVKINDIEEGNMANITVTTNSTFSGDVLVKVGDANYTVSVVKGIGNLPVSNLAPGTYNVAAVFKSNGIFNDGTATDSFKVTVKPVPLNLQLAVTNIEEGNVANITVTTNSTFTGNISVKVGDANYSVSVVKGIGSLQIPNLAVDTYIVTATFKSNGIFNDSTVSASFNVTAKPVIPVNPVTPANEPVIKLILKKVKIKKSAKKLVLKVTLKINDKFIKGKTIKFKFNKKTLKSKTNKKGVAKVIFKKKFLKKLKPGKKFKYQVSYGEKTVKNYVIVKK